MRLFILLLALAIFGNATLAMAEDLQRKKEIKDPNVYELEINGSITEIVFFEPISPLEKRTIILKSKIFGYYSDGGSYEKLFRSLDAEDKALLIEAIDKSSTFTKQEKSDVLEMLDKIDSGELTEKEQERLVLKLLVVIHGCTLQLKGTSLKESVEKTKPIKSEKNQPEGNVMIPQ